MSPSGTDKPKPDVTYLVNVYDRKDDGKKPIRREIWYYNEADLKTLNTLRNAGQPKKVSLPSDLPKDFNWSGKMFGMFSELLLDTCLAHQELTWDRRTAVFIDHTSNWPD